jgi:hypothetical protein
VAAGTTCPSTQYCSINGPIPYTFNQLAAISGVDCSTAANGVDSLVGQDPTGKKFARCINQVAINYYCCYGYTVKINNGVATCS